MDFLRNRAPLVGGDTREERKTPHLAHHAIYLAHRAIYLKPSQSFTTEIPTGS